MQLRFLLAVFFVFQSSAFAGETRFGIDKAVDLVRLEAQPITSGKPGLIQLSAKWDGHTVRIDASAVGDADFTELYELAGDYDAYKRLRMPYVDNAKLIERRTDGKLWVWSQMTLSVPGPDQTSQHYLEVSKVKFANGALGNSWVLVRMPKDSNLKDWDNPKFKKLDGSWYQEQLPSGRTYIRYFLSADIDSGIPAFLIRKIGGGQMSDGVRGVIRTLAQEASTSP